MAGLERGGPASRASGQGDLLVGIDVGTTNVKAVAYSDAGAVIAVATRPLPAHRPRLGWEQYVVAELIDTVCAVLRELVDSIDARRVRGVAVASMAETAAPLDAHGQPLHPALAWHDLRGLDEAEWFVEQLGRERLYAITGLGPRHIFGLYKLLWLRAHVPAAAGLRRWLNVADYVAYWLSGEQATDPTLATRTSLYDIRSGKLSPEILAAADLDPELFPPVVEAGTPLGPLTPDAAAATGLPADAIVAVGGHDHPCCALGIGLLDDSAVLDSIGTAESVFALVDEPVFDPQVARSGYEQGRYLAFGRPYAMGGVITSGAVVNWAAELIGLTGPDRHQRLVDLAAHGEPGAGGVLFLPHLRMANPPHDDPRSRAAFVGMSDTTGQPQLARAVLEGLACEFYLTYSGLRQLVGVAAEEVILTGGGAVNQVGVAVKQALLGRSIRLAADEQAASRGAAILAGVGSGVFADLSSAVASMRCSSTDLDPPEQADVDFYRGLYEHHYRPLYERLIPIHHPLAVDRSRD